MTENTALIIIQNYIANHKLTPIRIDARRLPSGKKSPDLEVKENTTLVFYCEVKTPDLKLNEATQMFHWTTTHSKLRDLIHKAVKQLRDYDPSHILPWVVAFTSSNFQLNWSNFVHCIQGAVAYNGEVVKDLTNTRFIKDTDQDVKDVDLFIWCQVNEEQKKIYQMVHFVNPNSLLLEETKVISEKLIPYVNEEITDKNTKKYV